MFIDAAASTSRRRSSAASSPARSAGRWRPRAADRGEPRRRAGADRGARGRADALGQDRRRRRLRDRRRRPVRGRDGSRRGSRDLPPGGAGADGGSRDALEIDAFGISYEGKSAFSPPRSPGRRELGRSGSVRRRAARGSGWSRCSARWPLRRVVVDDPVDGRHGREPGTDLGALGWFVGVWIVMMAAMMLPAVSPTVALYARMTRERARPPVAFTSGYLVVWGAAGLAAYGALRGRQARPRPRPRLAQRRPLVRRRATRRSRPSTS